MTRGTRWSVTAPTKAEVMHLAAEKRVRLGGEPSASGKITVGEMIAGHLAVVASKWSPTTYDDARRIEKRLPDTFTNRPVRKVTPSVIHALYRQFVDDGWSAHRIRKAHFLLSVSFGSAVVHGHIGANPCRDVHPPEIERSQVGAPDDEQVKAILARTSDVFRLFVRLAVATGARRGEIAALQWADIDFDAHTVHITRSLAQKVGGPPEVRATKTGKKGHRLLDLDATTIAALEARREGERGKAAGAALPDPVWVFSHDAGVTPWRPDYASRAFADARKAAGVSGVRLHDVRHYVATTMLQDGEAPIDVAGQLGHSSVATTLTTYASYLPGRGRDAAEKRANRLDG